MGSPTTPTLKKLFALSGNQCAFPNCKERLIEETAGILIGRVCHIKGNKPGSARHDPNQTEEERQGISNLIILCPKHHDVVDADLEAYTVERLLKMKADHEAKSRGVTEANEDLAERFAILIQNNTIKEGSIIHTQNQTGGQNAHVIYNNNQPRREFGQAIANAIVAELRKYPGERYVVTSCSTDGETTRFAKRLNDILSLSGWEMHSNVGLLMCPDSIGGEVVLMMPEEKESYQNLLTQLRRAGMDARAQIKAGAKLLEVLVGPK